MKFDEMTKEELIDYINNLSDIYTMREIKDIICLVGL